MAKQNSSPQLVRSDLRLMGLGLFSISLLLGVLGIFNVNLVGMSPTNDNIAERTIRVEEQPTAFGDLQNVEDSYAAEEFLMEEEMSESEMNIQSDMSGEYSQNSDAMEEMYFQE